MTESNEEEDKVRRADAATAEPRDPPEPVATQAEPEALFESDTLLSEEGEAPAARPSGDSPDYIGLVLDGRYQIESLLAEGGMGVVYRARHRLLDKHVAIKVLRPELATNAEITRRFLTEAQAASAIGSEHIVDITDFGELPDGATYIVMEYLEGLSLGQRLDQEGTLDEATVLALGTQIADALEAAHDAGIVHRDLKPDNVFLVERAGQAFVKVLDFGIAKVVSGENAKTRAGRIVGTPYYMSPEQSGGKPLDHRTDVYSVGVIFYEALGGRLPFVGDNPLAVLSQHIYAEPPRLSTFAGNGLSTGMEAVVHKCLMKAPAERYESMADLKEDLLRLSRGERPRAARDLPRRQQTTSPSRGRSRRRLWALAAIAGVSGAAFALWTNPEAPQRLWESLAREYTTVAVVLAPIDARLYHGDRDLGTMPLTVRVPRDSHMQLSVRRQGYQPRDVILDGRQSRLEVSLSPLAGSAPVPAPADAVPSGPMRTVTLDETVATPNPASYAPAPGAGEAIPGPPPVAAEQSQSATVADAGRPAPRQVRGGPKGGGFADAAAPMPKPKPKPRRAPPGPPPLKMVDAGRSRTR